MINKTIKTGDRVVVDYHAFKQTEITVDTEYDTQYSELEYCLDQEDQDFIQYLLNNVTFTVSMVDNIGKHGHTMVTLKELESVGIEQLFYVEDLIKIRG